MLHKMLWEGLRGGIIEKGKSRPEASIRVRIREYNQNPPCYLAEIRLGEGLPASGDKIRKLFNLIRLGPASHKTVGSTGFYLISGLTEHQWGGLSYMFLKG